MIALVGDGAMQMNGINELITIAKYRHRWPDQRLIVLVLNNRDLNQVTWEQRAMEGDPKFEGSQDLPDFPYARYAEMLGLKGIRVDTPEQRRPGLGRGAGRRPAGRARGGHRSRGAAAAAAHHDRAGQGAQLGAARGRSGRAAGSSGSRSSRRSRSSCPGDEHARRTRVEAPVEELEVAAYTIPTDAPEADGTLAWDATTIVVVHAHGGGETGLGYTYADVSTAKLIESKLAGVVRGRDAMAPAGGVGGDGAARSATSAARGSPRWRSPPSTSRCGTSRRGCSGCRCASCSGWPTTACRSTARAASPPTRPSGSPSSSPAGSSEGIPRVKMKVGSAPDDDPERVRGAREAIGPDAELFVDANGAYSRKQALALAERFRARGRVSAGSRSRSPPTTSRACGCCATARRPGWTIAAGEYGYDAPYFRADARGRRGRRAPGRRHPLRRDHRAAAGRTALCRAHSLPLSLHCGPAIHLHPGAGARAAASTSSTSTTTCGSSSCCSTASSSPRDGALYPDLERPGNGLELKRAEAERYAA